MTQAKKLKGRIRARARKTGERYSGARRQVLRARPASSTRGAVSDSSIRRKTGHGLDHWFAVLEGFEPRAKSHTDRARHLHEEQAVPRWHAQGIAVAYERSRGLRVTNQSCAGSFQVSVSRAVPVPVREVVRAIADARRRRGWLKQADPALARAVEAAFSRDEPRRVRLKDPQNARIRIPWDGSTVEIRITGKPDGGATVVADNENLRRQSLVEERRAQWKVALDALKARLSERPTARKGAAPGR